MSHTPPQPRLSDDLDAAFSKRIARLVRGKGIRRVQDCTRLNVAVMLGEHHFGEKAVETIRRELARRGLYLFGDPPYRSLADLYRNPAIALRHAALFGVHAGTETREGRTVHLVRIDGTDFIMELQVPDETAHAEG